MGVLTLIFLITAFMKGVKLKYSFKVMGHQIPDLSICLLSDIYSIIGYFFKDQRSQVELFKNLLSTDTSYGEAV